MSESVDVAIREAAKTDSAAFAKFFWEAWHEAGPNAPGFVGASDEIIAELTTPEVFSARVGGPKRRMFLAWRGDVVVGFASTRTVDDRRVELSGIIVLAAMSGHGIGTRLVEAARATTGGRVMVVHTEKTNLAARAFYEGCGFEVAGTASEDVEGVKVPVWELRLG